MIVSSNNLTIQFFNNLIVLFEKSSINILLKPPVLQIKYYLSEDKKNYKSFDDPSPTVFKKKCETTTPPDHNAAETVDRSFHELLVDFLHPEYNHSVY